MSMPRARTGANLFADDVPEATKTMNAATEARDAEGRSPGPTAPGNGERAVPAHGTVRAMGERIAVVGGGIGGLTCAVALQQRGFEVGVYEAAPKLEMVGAGIWLPPNALLVMERLGLSEELEAAGLSLDRIEVRDGSRTVSAIDLMAVKEAIGHTTVSIHRAELQRVLASHVDELHLGKKCAGVEGTTVRFEDGTEIEADVVIGADGIRSAVRQSLFPDVPLRFSGQTCYRGIAPLTLPDGLQTVCRETWGGTHRFGFSAIGEGEVYWFAPVATEPGGVADAADLEALRAAFGQFVDPIPAIVEATPDEAIQRLDLFDFEPLPRWHVGSVGLIGDAAHATTPNLGQGGAQAIESALCVATCLADEADAVAAFAKYETIRRPKTKMITERSFRWGQVAHLQHPVMRFTRNLALRTTPDAFTRRQLERVYSIDD